MRNVRWLAVPLGLLLGTTAVIAQGRRTSLGWSGGGLSVGSSLSFTYTRSSTPGSLVVWRSYGPLLGPSLSPDLPVLPGYVPLQPYGPPPPNVTINYFSPPPIIALPPAQPRREEEPPLGVPPLPPLPPLPGQRAPAAPAKPEKPDKPEPAAAPRPPLREPPLPRVLPEPDPRAENARLVALGREAVAVQEYGRAEQRFRQATEVAPGEPLAYFLLAQARVALGKYHEAIAAIAAGLPLRPEWPTAAFRPLELYGENVADFAEHQYLLAEALARHPDEPVLLFLSAYELWFDGRQEEALLLFQRAAERGAARQLLDPFLRSGTSGPLLFR